MGVIAHIVLKSLDPVKLLYIKRLSAKSKYKGPEY